MQEDLEKKIKDQEEEINRLRKDLKDAASLKSFWKVFKKTCKNTFDECIHREQKIKNQDKEIQQLKKELAEAKKETEPPQKPSEETEAIDDGTEEPVSCIKPKDFEKCNIDALKSLFASSGQNPGDDKPSEQNHDSQKPQLEENTYAQKSTQNTVTDTSPGSVPTNNEDETSEKKDTAQTSEDTTTQDVSDIPDIPDISIEAPKNWMDEEMNDGTDVFNDDDIL